MNNAEISKCLREVSALVAAGHPYEECVQSRWEPEYARKHGCFFGWSGNRSPDWIDPNFEFRVAKGFLEGKAVFEGDVLYGKVSGEKYVVCGDSSIMTTAFGAYPYADLFSVSWTPPAPKVEIPEGFTAWHGGKCPLTHSLPTHLLFRSNNCFVSGKAHWHSWRHTGGDDDIIAYKVHKPTTFELNGKVLPMPDFVGEYKWESSCYGVHAVGKAWWYKSKTDADKIRAAFAKLGEGL